MKTKDKCQVGDTIFDVGVSYEVVIKRAELEYRRKRSQDNKAKDLAKALAGQSFTDYVKYKEG